MSQQKLYLIEFVIPKMIYKHAIIIITDAKDIENIRVFI